MTPTKRFSLLIATFVFVASSVAAQKPVKQYTNRYLKNADISSR